MQHAPASLIRWYWFAPISLQRVCARGRFKATSCLLRGDLYAVCLFKHILHLRGELFELKWRKLLPFVAPYQGCSISIWITAVTGSALLFFSAFSFLFCYWVVLSIVSFVVGPFCKWQENPIHLISWRAFTQGTSCKLPANITQYSPAPRSYPAHKLRPHGSLCERD